MNNLLFRLLWILIPIMVLAFGAYLAVCLFNSYEQVPTLITVDKPVPIQAVVFPAITFCHPQTVIDYKARLFVQKMYVQRSQRARKRVIQNVYNNYTLHIVNCRMVLTKTRC